jgi:hypothetical protein
MQLNSLPNDLLLELLSSGEMEMITAHQRAKLASGELNLNMKRINHPLHKHP